MEIFSINQVPHRLNAQWALSHIKKWQTKITVNQVGMPKPTVPAQSRKRNPVDSKSVLLEITENNDWFKDLDMSSNSASENEAKRTAKTSLPMTLDTHLFCLS